MTLISIELFHPISTSFFGTQESPWSFKRTGSTAIDECPVVIKIIHYHRKFTLEGLAYKLDCVLSCLLQAVLTQCNKSVANIPVSFCYIRLIQH